MATTRVQSKHTYPSDNATFTSTVSSGNLIVVCVSADSTVGTLSASDNLGNTYTLVKQQNSSANNTTAAVLYANVTHSGTCTVTVGGTNVVSNDGGLTVIEYSGLQTPVTVQGYGVNNASPLTASVAATAGDLIVAAYGNETSDNYSSPATNFSLIQHDATHVDAQVEYLSVSATGSVASGVNVGGANIADALAVGQFTASNRAPLKGQSPQDILQTISGVTATIQVILNRQLGAPSDNYYTVQAALNVGAGRAPNALTTQAALKANTGFVGQGSIQDILLYAYNNGLTMSKIVTGS